jgi:chromosome segregation ATPase
MLMAAYQTSSNGSWLQSQGLFLFLCVVVLQLQQRCTADTEAAKAAAAAAGAERAQAQEQLAYLRGQLQLVLQESDRELGLLQEQLAGSREEVEALRGAVAAASGRQQQQTELMNELTQSLAQHKAQLQVGVRRWG